MKYLYLIPEEVRNANLVSKELGKVALSGSSNQAYIWWNLLVLTLGTVAGYLSSSFVDDNLLNAVIAFDGVIMGFVITAMLFSGRSQYLSKMSYEQTVLYAHKTKYMLMSQINTLFSFLVCLLFSVLSMVALKSGGFFSKNVLVALSAGYFFLGCYRVLLLPFQIYDVHSLALDNLVADSGANTAAEVKSKTSDRLRML
jgi:hypothetical protein